MQKLPHILFFPLALLLLATPVTRATHSQGADIAYRCLGGNQYEISLAFYRDCSGISAPNTVSISLRSSTCGENLNLTLTRVAGTGREITPICPAMASTCTGGTFPGVQEYVYSGIITLPQQCTDWIFSFTLCCRNGAISTINNPLSQQIYVEANLDNLNYPCNSSPSFTNPPVPFVCEDQTYCFNHGAMDSDGDSLVYSLITPRHNATTPITYLPGYSAGQPVSTTIPTTINPVTGDVCITPDQQEVTVFAVLVQEFRNGVLIGSVVRDIQVQVIACTNTNPYLTGIDGTGLYSATVCVGTTLNFTIPSFDADLGQNVTLTWNNGIPAGVFNAGVGSRPIGSFTWTPSVADVNTIPYCFTVTVEDDNCPFQGSQTYSFCITVAGAQVDAGPDQVLCRTSATANLNGSILPAGTSYTWVNGMGTYAPSHTVLNPNYTPSAAELAAGQAVLVLAATGSAGCPTTNDTIVLQFIDMLGIVSQTAIPVTCFGDADGQAGVTVIGGNAPFTYSWNTFPNQTTATATGLNPGTYVVTIVDAAGCEATETVVVTEPAALSLSNDYTAVSCNGGTDGSASVAVLGGTAPYAYSWLTAPIQTTATAVGLSASPYTVTVTDDSGCTITTSIAVTEPSALAVNLISSDSVDCFGGADGELTVIGSGGVGDYSYLWNTIPAHFGSTAAGLSAGTYQVSVQDSNGCSVQASFTVEEPPVLQLGLSSLSDVNCFGEGNGAASVAAIGGTPTYSYLWNTVPQVMGNSIANVPAGNYVVSVQDQKSCGASFPVVITQPDSLELVLISSDSVDCSGGADGSAVVLANGGTPAYSYAWNTLPMQTSSTAINLSQGSYIAMVTDAAGCVAIAGVLINEPSALSISATLTDASCFGFTDGTATAVAVGGTLPHSFAWNTSPAQNTTAISGLGAANYTCIVTDRYGCTASTSAIVAQPSALTVNLSAIDSVSCHGAANGSITASVAGGIGPYLPIWNSIPNQYTMTASALPPGSYEIVVTDQNQCTATATSSIQEPPLLLLSEATNQPVTCNGGADGAATVAATGGTAPYSYFWNCTPIQIGTNAIGLQAGPYEVSVTDYNGCITTLVVRIEEPSPVITSAFGGDTICSGDLIALSAAATGGNGPYSFQWDQGLGTSANVGISPASTNTYAVVSYDVNGCPGTVANVTVTVNNILNANLIMGPDASVCAGDAVNLFAHIANGMRTYSYSWNNGIGNVGGFVNLIPSQSAYYVVRVMDECNNMLLDSIYVEVLDGPRFQLQSQEAGSCSSAEVKFGFGLSSVSALSYFWDFGNGTYSYSKTAMATYSESGTYQVVLRAISVAGCVTTDTTEVLVTIWEGAHADFVVPQPLVSLHGDPISLFNQSSNASNFFWDFGDGSISTQEQPVSHQFKTAGQYLITLIANNENNCPDTTSKLVSITPESSFYVPNVFTPNGDGVNDYFLTMGMQIRDFDLQVFDRWGLLVFHSNNMSAGWDGTFKGSNAQQDVYIWKVTLRDFTGAGQEYNGHVSLVR